MNKTEFIEAAYAEVRSLLDISGVRGKPLIAWLHSRDRRENDGAGGRAVTLRIDGQLVDRGKRMVFTAPVDALSFYNAVVSALNKMEPPIEG